MRKQYGLDKPFNSMMYAYTLLVPSVLFCERGFSGLLKAISAGPSSTDIWRWEGSWWAIGCCCPVTYLKLCLQLLGSILYHYSRSRRFHDSRW